MITPKEKAEELITKQRAIMMRYIGADSFEEYIKELVLFTVNEIINTDALLTAEDAECIDGYEDTILLQYWQQVKQEIENYE